MSTLTDINDWITVEEAANRVGKSRVTVNLWIMDGKVRAFKPGSRAWLVYWPSVVEYRVTGMPQGKTEATPAPSP